MAKLRELQKEAINIYWNILWFSMQCGQNIQAVILRNAGHGAH